MTGKKWTRKAPLFYCPFECKWSIELQWKKEGDTIASPESQIDDHMKAEHLAQFVPIWNDEEMIDYEIHMITDEPEIWLP